MKTFFEKLAATVNRNASLLCVGLDPDTQRVPAKYRSESNPLLAWNQAIISATLDLACAYKPNLAFYTALGRPGHDLLEGSLAAIPPEMPVILDAKYGDIGSTAEAYAQTAFDVWGADAVTLNPYLGYDSVEPFLRRPERGVFLLCRTSNPGARDLQNLTVGGRPLYEAVAERVLGWSKQGNIGLVVGATAPEELRAVRQSTPDTWLLAPGVGAQGADLAATLAAGLSANGAGLLINLSRSLAAAPDMRAYAQGLRDQMNQLRAAHTTAPAEDPTLERLALALHEIGAVQFGEFTLHSGKLSPIYIDLRLLASDPGTLRLAADAYARKLGSLTYTRIAAIPYAALPIATAVSLALGVPMIYPRKEAKAYGTAKSIEGRYVAGEQVAVLDDLITNGESKLEAIQPLEAAGLHVRDIVVLIDREQGGAASLAERGYQLHAVMRLSQLLDILVRHGRIADEERMRVRAFLGLAATAAEVTHA